MNVSRWLLLCGSLAMGARSLSGGLAADAGVLQAPVSSVTAASAWSVVGAGWGRPAADDASAYFLTAEHHVVAIDLASSRVRWRQRTGGSGARPLGSRVLVAGSSVVAGDSALVALARHDGHERWRFDPDDGGTVGPYLGVASADTIYSGSSSGRLHAVVAASGVRRWSALPVGGGPGTTLYEPIVDGGQVFAGFTTFLPKKSGGVVAVDANTGAPLWRTLFPSSRGRAEAWAGGLAVAGNLVIASSSSGQIVGFDRSTGETLWRVENIDGVASSGSGPPAASSDSAPDFRPIVVSKSQFVAGSLLGTVVAYDLETRRQRWSAGGRWLGSVAMAMVTDSDVV
ncbi:MAG: PQQ-binding-like beta-propeller repeat protein, partial [Vicinamibacterales bacterium]